MPPPDSKPVTVVVTPSYQCNFACDYCYNDPLLDKRRMSLTTLDALFGRLEEYVEPWHRLNFRWIGGEPLVHSKEYFERAVELQGRLTCDVSNSLQTNGSLLTQEMIEPLRTGGFSVCVSLDGPPHINDRHRRTRGGAGTYQRIVRAIDLLRDASIPHSLSVVIHRGHLGKISELYAFLRQLGCPLAISPIFSLGSAETSPSIALSREEEQAVLVELFDHWVREEGEYLEINPFEGIVAAFLRRRSPSTACEIAHDCVGYHWAVQPNGDFFPCFKVVTEAELRLGNVHQDSVSTMLSGSVIQQLRRRQERLTECGGCQFANLCNGGCWASARFAGQAQRRDPRCRVFYHLFDHVERRLEEVMWLNINAVPEREV